MIISILDPLPTHIVTSPLTSLCSFCNSCFELVILATELVSNTQGLLRTQVRYTIICISNIPLFTLPSFLSAKCLGQFHFQWPFPLQYKHSISGLGPALGFFMGVATCLPFFLKFPFFSFALFLETSGLVNHQHLMLFVNFYLRWFQHREELGNRFPHPLHIIVHHEVLVTWW